MEKEIIRCSWSEKTELMREYHDTEWGVPVHNDEKHFEFLLLDAMQAGLSWETILKKRISYRAAFDEFNYMKIALYDVDMIEVLMQNAGIIRNRLKVVAAIKNAQHFIEIQKEFGSFDAYIWQFVDGKTIYTKRALESDILAQSSESVKMSIDLRKRGFQFVGPVICYAYMQAAGLIHDHVQACFLYKDMENI